MSPTMSPTMKPTMTATVGDRALTFTLPIDSPARAVALTQVASTIVRGDDAKFGPALQASGEASLEDVEAAYERLRASHGFLIGATLTAIDGAPVALDAVARGKLPSPTCPTCASVQTIVTTGGGRRCVDCRHTWTDPDDARRFVGPDWRRDFGFAAFDEVAALGFARGALNKIGAALRGSLDKIAGSEDGASVSFS